MSSTRRELLVEIKDEGQAKLGKERTDRTLSSETLHGTNLKSFPHHREWWIPTKGVLSGKRLSLAPSKLTDKHHHGDLRLLWDERGFHAHQNFNET